MTDAQFLDFNQKWMDAVLPYLVDGGILGTFIDWRGLPIVHAAATALGLTPLNLVVWAKTNAGMGSLYRSQHELTAAFQEGRRLTRQQHFSWQARTPSHELVDLSRSASLLDQTPGKVYRIIRLVKPTAMLQDALIDLTNRGDIVLDPFLGSGSTFIAAENTGRVCCGIELDPLYVDVIIRRYEALTRMTAVLADTSEPFATLAARRHSDTATPVR